MSGISSIPPPSHDPSSLDPNLNGPSRRTLPTTAFTVARTPPTSPTRTPTQKEQDELDAGAAKVGASAASTCASNGGTVAQQMAAAAKAAADIEHQYGDSIGVPQSAVAKASKAASQAALDVAAADAGAKADAATFAHDKMSSPEVRGTAARNAAIAVEAKNGASSADQVKAGQAAYDTAAAAAKTDLELQGWIAAHPGQIPPKILEGMIMSMINDMINDENKHNQKMHQERIERQAEDG